MTDDSKGEKMSALGELRRGIQQQLHQFIISSNSEMLYKLAESIQDEIEGGVPGKDASDLELYDFIVDFLKSDELASREDQGMSSLLIFKDLITGLQPSPVATEEQQELMEETEFILAPLAVDGRTNRSPVVNQVTDVIKLTDVAALLPRREFKLHSGQISDSESDVSYSSLCRQIDEGLSENFTKAEVIRTILKIIRPGTFKYMLMTKDGLTVAQLNSNVFSEHTYETRVVQSYFRSLAMQSNRKKKTHSSSCTG